MRVVTLLDTAVASTNLGDQIIMEAVRAELAGVLSDAFIYSVASHEKMSGKSRGLIRRSDFAIAGGSNLLSSRMWIRSVWKLSPLDALRIDNVVLMGCGWYQFQVAPDPYTAWLLRRVLCRGHLHSVRDSYTLKRLAGIGITNVVNTGCPTLWALTPEHCQSLPRAKGKQVVTTVNTYMPDVEADRRLLQTLRRHYDRVHLWIQTASDYVYAKDLDPALEFLAPSLRAFDELLETGADLDYVGNRLHAGIRALQKGRRAIIVEIDNRAREMGCDFALPTVERTNFERLEAMIDGPLEIAVQPPRDLVEKWKSGLFDGGD
jgi:polysaccharide pyruvyl transferase WcaK-like protein